LKTIRHILIKEFIQIFRNKMMLPIIFLMPIVQLVLLVHAATLEMKKIDMFVVDKDLSSTSRQLINKFQSSDFFTITDASFSLQEANDRLEKDEADIILYLPQKFEQDLNRDGIGEVQLLINGINGMAAGLISAYTTSIIADYNNQIIADNVLGKNIIPVDITHSFWYNPELNYKIYMLPGILVILVTLIGLFLTALNLVREKEMGTIEQINVTPIKKYQFIIGKLLPFWVIGVLELTIGLVVGWLFFSVPVNGSILLLYGFVTVYLLVVMGIGLFISTFSSTQQQVMFIAFFFLLTFILRSGIFTPMESMPKWANYANYINPLAYFMRIIRMVLLKGSAFADISREFLYMSVYAVIILSLAIWRYRKVA